MALSPSRRTMRRAMWRSFWRVGGLALSVALAVPLSGAVWFFSAPGELETLAEGPVRTWAFLEAEKARGAKVRTTYVPLRNIAVDARYAVVAGEDINFFNHQGFDVVAMREAWDEWRAGEREQLRGASTLTQQLAKNLFLDDERSLWRKLEEARYAYWLERRLGKRRILELYANIVEVGPGLFGLEAGAQAYFGVSAAALTTEEAAALAAAIPSPKRHNPKTVTRSFEIRKEAITARMAQYDNVRARLHAWGSAARPATPTATVPVELESEGPTPAE